MNKYNSINLYGRILKKRKFKNIIFLEVFSPNDKKYLVVVKDRNIINEVKELRIGSIIQIEGIIKPSELSKSYEYEIIPKKLNIIARNYNEKINIFERKPPQMWTPSNSILFLLSDKKKVILELRSYVLYQIHNFFYKLGFIEIHSPKIVGEIVAGPTSAFVIDYYNRRKYLSISNVLYHHILLILGYNRIYEISPLFRQQKYGTKYQLSEFWVLDFSQSWADRERMIKTLEDLLYNIFTNIPSELEQKLKKENIRLPRLPEYIERIDYQKVLQWLNINKESYGTHIPIRLSKILREKSTPLVWVIDAPPEKKPFFIKRKNGKALTAELWTDRVPILASGGERVTDYKEALNNLKSLNLDPKLFEPYLEILKLGAPPSYTIGMGIERLLQYMTNAPLYYLTLFPRFADTDFYL